MRREKKDYFMPSNKPYLIRAFYQWIIDCDLTPYITVNTKIEKIDLPETLTKRKNIIFDISPEAVKDLQIKNRVVSFTASFSGEVYYLDIPVRVITAIYAKENGEGQAFTIENSTDDLPPDEEDEFAQASIDTSHLRLVEE